MMHRKPLYQILGWALLTTAGLQGITACAPVAVAGLAGGTASAIVDERTAGRMMDDTGIKVRIKDLYTQTDVNDLLPNVTVDVHEGRVMLTGVVNREETILRAVELAWRVAGVREVINELQLRSQVSISRLSKDTLAANGVRSRLLATKGIRSANYMVECYNGVLYLFGVAQTQQELEAAMRVAATTNHVRKVVSHVRLKDSPLRSDMAPKVTDETYPTTSPEGNVNPTSVNRTANGVDYRGIAPAQAASQGETGVVYDGGSYRDDSSGIAPDEQYQPQQPVEMGEIPD